MTRKVTTVEYPIRLILSYVRVSDGSSRANGLQIICENRTGEVFTITLDSCHAIRFIDDGPSIAVMDKIEETEKAHLLTAREILTTRFDVREVRIRRDFQTQTK